MFRSGQKVGIYTLITKLGRGGFGEVWLAEKRTQFVTKKVAVKLPHEEQVNFDAIRQEATLWEQASGHPNVLPIIDADVYDEQVVIVSEYADGGSLADKIKRDGKLPLQQAVEMTIGILSGLEFLHSRQIIHRDIKPQNILLQGNTPRLADFGISRAMQTTVVSSAIIGTDAYMSPESFDGKRNAQTDIWSVGVVLYELIKGKLPFPQEHPSERMFAVLTKEFEPLPDEVPLGVRRIVQKALAKQPENRFQTAEEMRVDLQKALIGIAHPTLAKTEALNRSALPNVDTSEQAFQTSEPVKQTEAPTVALNNLTEATEIKTVVNKQANQPAPTEPAYPKQSVVTQFRQSSTAENPPVNFADQSLPVSDNVSGGKKRRKFIAYAALAVITLFTVFSFLAYALFSSSGSKTSSSNSNQTLLAGTNPTPNPYEIYTPLKEFKEGDKHGYKNNEGVVVIPAKYEEASFMFDEGFATVKFEGKWGHIDDKGNPLYPFKYDYAYTFSEGIAFVQLNKKWGAVDRTGKEIFPFIYDEGALFSEGLAGVEINDKKGYIDRTGKEIIPLKYYDVGYFKGGLSYACTGDFYKKNCAVIDKTGKEITPYKYDFISDFFNDLSIVTVDKKSGYIDKTGKEVIPLIYDDAGVFTYEGFAEVKRDGRNYRVDKNGEETDIGAVTPYPSSNTTMANTQKTP